jgi:hypothetical protein
VPRRPALQEGPSLTVTHCQGADGQLSPAILSAFVARRARTGLARTTERSDCGILRVFLRYAHRNGLLSERTARLPAGRAPTGQQTFELPVRFTRSK